MVLDMANFTIEMAKPEIIAHSVELERKKFADLLSVQVGEHFYLIPILMVL